MKVIESSAKIAEIESRLNKYSYLSKNSLPGSADAKVFRILEFIKRYPDRKTNPNFYHWYILMKQFSPATTAKWASDELFHDPDDSLVSDFVSMHQPKKEESVDFNESVLAELPNRKAENWEYEYTIDVTVKDSSEEKMAALRKALEEYRAELIDFKDQPCCIRILCRIDAANSQEMINKVQKCIEFDNIEIKKEKRPRKSPQSALDKTTELP